MVYESINRSFHVQLPFLLSSINESEMKQLGKLFQAIFNKSFWCMADMYSYIFWNLMEMVQLVPNYPD